MPDAEVRDATLSAAEFETKLAEKDARIAELEGEVARIAELEGEVARIAELEDKVAKLEAKIEQLLEKLGQNSSNSHLPPSSDGPGAGKNERKPKSKGKRKRGGQKGHRGAHRELLPPERVDEVIDLFPEVCLGCGVTLPQLVDDEPRRHQLLELEPSGPHVTEFRRHEVACSRCGGRTRVSCREAKIPASSFGPRLVAVVVMLTGVYHLGRRKVQRLLGELFHIQISLGALSAMEARASAALKPAFDEAKAEAERAEVKHTDATPWIRAGSLMSLWVLASTLVTVYRILDDGRRETIRPLYGPPKGILVSDRATVFLFWEMASRQICWAHLLRKFVSFSERDGPVGARGRELLERTSLVFEYWRGFVDGALDRAQLERLLEPVKRQFEAVLARAVADQEARLSGSCADILAHADALWTFVTHEGVEPTNNHAERELRAFVLWRKRSFGSQSERGERFAERVMTVAHTARKLGKDVLDFIVGCVRAQLEATTAPRLLEGSASAT
nr:IS66 family transposase [Pseudenhygromyxa sp. WMMC2535]